MEDGVIDIPKADPSSAAGKALSGWRGAISLLVLCVAVFVPGFFALPAVDRDEARFAQASRQMFESGDYVIPRVQGRERLNKPPLIYWLQAGAARVFTMGKPARDAIWMYRFPSLLGAIAAVLATWRLGTSMFGARVGWLAGALLACCPLMFWETRQARADMVLTACTAWGLYFLWRLWDVRNASPGRPGLWWAIGLWIMIGAGTLVKGPITPAVLAFTAVVLSAVTRRWRWVIRPDALAGIALVSLMVGPWVYLIARKIGVEAYASILYNEVIGRSLAPMEGHKGFPGYHLALACALLFPGSMMIVPAVISGVRMSRTAAKSLRANDAAQPNESSRQCQATLFLMCAIIPTWLTFELVSTKLPHYTLPIYPAIAALCARAVLDRSQWAQNFVRRPFAQAALGVWVLGLVALVLAAGGVAAFATDSTPWRVAIMVTAGAVAVLVAIRCIKELRRFNMPRLQALGLATFIGCGVVFASVLPFIDPPWVSRRLAAHLAAIDPSHARPIGTLFHEDSLIFETRGRAERVAATEPGNAVLDWSRQHPDGLLIVPTDLGARLPGFQSLAGVQGFNYTKGDPVDLAVGEIVP